MYGKEKLELFEVYKKYREKENFEPVKPEEVMNIMELSYTEFDNMDVLNPEYNIPMSIYIDLDELKLYAEYYDCPAKYFKVVLEEYSNVREIIAAIESHNSEELCCLGINDFKRNKKEKI